MAGGRSKVKSGCRTCKVRRVKCDEGRPACHRCVSTGRVCDGYGIWGGGNRPRPVQQHEIRDEDAIIEPQPSLSMLPANTNKQNEHLEWFRLRAAVKLPGSFNSRFWDILLHQSSVSEPAILHAILALSSVHKSGVYNVAYQRTISNGTTEEEKFTLQQYTKAITHLKPHFWAQNKASSRVALITCLVFVYLELLRGHFATAETHLQNGLKILRVLQLLSHIEADGIFCWKLGSDSTDAWIVEAFSRLHLQFELFRHGYQHSCIVLQPRPTDVVLSEIGSFHDAWLQLEKLFNKIFYVSYYSRQHATNNNGSSLAALALGEYQQEVRTELLRWSRMLDIFVKSLESDRSGPQERTQGKGYHTICMYHTMATIMAGTCLQPDNEAAYDEHIDDFALMMRQAPKVWTLALKKLPINDLPTNSIDMARSIIDMGWIPPLFYTAVKCRVHRIRLQAIRLLESSSHREGIWDSRVAACVARKVMELEEGNFYGEVKGLDDFPLMSSPRPQDLSLPILPVSRRLREVEIGLLGAPMNTIQLFCQETQGHMDSRVLKAQYDIHSQQWNDIDRDLNPSGRAQP